MYQGSGPVDGAGGDVAGGIAGEGDEFAAELDMGAEAGGEGRGSGMGENFYLVLLSNASGRRGERQ